MNIAKFSVTRPVTVTMRVAALVLLGAICLTRLPIDLLPKVSIPTLSVNTTWPNVAPEEMETQITRPVEQAVSSAQNISQVTSSTSQGSSSVRIQFNWGTDIGQAAVDVLQLVQRASRNFPDDPTIQAPSVFKFDPSAIPIVVYAISGEDDPVKLRTTLENEIVPMIESADGVAAANVTGGQTRAIMIDVDPKKLQAYGLSLNDVQKRIVQENLNQSAGIAKEGDTEFTIRSVNYLKLPDFPKLPVGVFNGAVVPLGSVATIRDSHQETRIQTWLNGEPAVGLSITKQSDANTVSTAASVKEHIKAVQRAYPHLKFSVAYDQSGFIENSIEDLKRTALIGGVLAILILMFFLRNVRSTLVVAMSIPISITSTFALLYFGGFTLNTISLSGLALATGLIVDDAVVVLENIYRHIERDKRRAAEAAVTGTTEIMSAVTASTFTVMIVFLPLLLIKGQSGQTFTQFALVVIFSIAVSLLDATTLVPMLASRLIKEEEIEEEAHPELRAQRGKKVGPLTKFFDWAGAKLNAMDASYHNGLKWAIGHRWWVVGGAIAITASSWLLVPMIGSEMLPKTDSGDFTVNVKLPVGTALTTTTGVMKRVEKILLDNPEIQTVFLGSGTNLSFRGVGSNAISYQGGATVRLKEDHKKSTQEVIKGVQRQLGQIPGIRAQVTPYDLVSQILTGNTTNMEVDVFGQNQEELSKKAKEVQQAMSKVPGLESVDISLQEATPELQWTIDRDKALSYGVAFQDIANAISSATNGTLSSYYQEKGYQYPIYVQLPENTRRTREELMNLPITPSLRPAGTTTPVKQITLGQVATPSVALGPNEITRIDRQRYVAVNGRVADRSESEVQADISTALKGVEFNNGLRWDFGRNQQRRAEEFSGLGVAVGLAIALIYMLLASQFESFIYPLIVLTSVPLCAFGVVVALFVTGKAFGLTAFIGLLMLIGIVVKNGILLVDYTNQLRSRGLGRDEAILRASPTRLRPILMTTFAAMLGMLPLAMGIGKGTETQAPLATAVVGGLCTSTFLTLFVVPCVYTFFDDMARKFRKNDIDLAAATLIEPSVEALEKRPVPEDHSSETPEAKPHA